MKKKLVTLSLDPATVDRVDTIARDMKIPRSWVFQQVMQGWLDEHFASAVRHVGAEDAPERLEAHA